LNLPDIIKGLRGIFERKRKNPLQLDNDSNLESNLKPLKVSNKSTPLQISEDTVDVKGSLKVNGVDVSTEPDEAGSGGASSLDELSDVTYSSGDLTITSLDTIVAGGNLTLDVEGDIALDANGGDVYILDNGSQLIHFFNGGIAVGEATYRNNLINYDGDDLLEFASEELTLNKYLKITAASSAASNTVGKGQLWVKNDTPNNLYFTNGAGTDIPITNNGVIANQKFFIKSAFFHGGSNDEFIPLAGGSTIEVTSLNDFTVDDSNFIVPYDLKINTIYANVARQSSSTQNPGNTSLQLYKDGSAYSGTVTVNLSSVGFDLTNIHTVYTWDFTGETNTYSAGEVMQIEIDPASTLQYVSITVAGEYT
jgi:hypothetical protein